MYYIREDFNCEWEEYDCDEEDAIQKYCESWFNDGDDPDELVIHISQDRESFRVVQIEISWSWYAYHEDVKCCYNCSLSGGCGKRSSDPDKRTDCEGYKRDEDEIPEVVYHVEDRFWGRVRGYKINDEEDS